MQTIKAWNELQNTGILQGKEKLVWEEFLIPYQWMISQMIKYIGNKPNENCYPIWAWYQWKDDKHKRPDLRRKGHSPKGEKCVLIKLNVPDKLVLLSDFSTWHYALNYWYLPLNELDNKEFKESRLDNFIQEPLSNETYHNKIVESWNKIFDLDWYDEYINDPKNKKMIQATMWEIRLEWVKSVKEFIGKG